MSVGHFPYPLEGESTYGVCARHHLISRASRPADTAEQLLGVASAHQYPGLPISLDRLAALTGSCIASSESTIRERSMLAPFWALLPAERRAALLAACRRHGAPSVRARAGLNRYTECVGLLKFCRTCVASHLDREGFSYWIAKHHWPGTWFCESHRELLSFVRQDAVAAGWHLPHQLVDRSIQPTMDVRAQLLLWRLQRTMSWFAASAQINTIILQVVLRVRLKVAGYCRSELKFREEERIHLASSSRTAFGAVSVPDVQALNSKEWMHVLLSERRHYNPLTWGMALSWLEQPSGDLKREYEDALSRKPQADIFDPYARRARRTAAPRHVYQRLVPRDPVKQGEGGDLNETTRWLQADAWLRAEIFQERRNWAVDSIRSCIQAFPSITSPELKRRLPDQYQWLFGHDRRTLGHLVRSVCSDSDGQLRLDF